jgi:acetyltransferase-like isoleucine patch superfamily enzyme
MIKRIIHESIEGFLRYRNGLIGKKLRYFYYRKRLAACGKNVIIDSGVFIESPQDVFLGDNIWIDKNVILLAGKPNSKRNISYKNISKDDIEIGKIRIGDNVHIAPNVVIQGHGGVKIGDNSGVASGSKIYSFSHHYQDLNKKNNQTYFFTPMVKNEEQALILSPVKIGFGCAIGLNSVILPGTVVQDYSWIGSGVVLQNSTVSEKSVLFNIPNHKEKKI